MGNRTILKLEIILERLEDGDGNPVGADTANYSMTYADADADAQLVALHLFRLANATQHLGDNVGYISRPDRYPWAPLRTES